MEFIFLGTSSGIPTKQRNVSGLGIRYRHKRPWMLIDCGEGTQHQLLHAPLSLIDLEAILITHVHGDHCYGLPGLIASAAMAGRTEPLTIIAPSGIKEFVEAAIQYTDMHRHYELNFIATETFDQSNAFSFGITPVKLSHRVPTFAYVFTEKNISAKLDIRKLKEKDIPSGPAWGLLLKQKEVVLDDKRILQSKDYYLPQRKARSIVIGGDNDTPALLSQACAEANVLVHESTYTEVISQKVGPIPMHSSAQKIAQFAQDVGIKNLVLTHFSARYQHHGSHGNSINEIRDEAKEHYSGALFLANDLEHYWLNLHGDLVLIDDDKNKK